MVNSFWEVLRDTIIIPADHSAYRTVPSATPWCFKFQPFLHWFIQVQEGKPNEEEAWITLSPAGRFFVASNIPQVLQQAHVDV